MWQGKNARPVKIGLWSVELVWDGCKMERNVSCFLCGNELSDRFCICADLAPVGPACWETHLTKAKTGFHFALPLAAKQYVTRDNQREYKFWLLALTDSQDKLRANLFAVDRCCADIQTAYEGLIQDIIKAKDQVLDKLQTFKAAFAACIDQAIQETSDNAYRSDYEPSSFLAKQVWTHCLENSSQDIPVFRYEIKCTNEHLRDPPEIAIQTAVPELVFSHASGGSQLVQQLNRLEETNETQIFTEESTQLGKEGVALAEEIAGWKGRCQRLEGEVQSLIANREKAACLEQEVATMRTQSEKDSATRQLHEAKLKGEIEELKKHCQAMEGEVKRLIAESQEAAQLKQEITAMRAQSEEDKATRQRQDAKWKEKIELLKGNCQALEGKVQRLTPYQQEAVQLRNEVAVLQEKAKTGAKREEELTIRWQLRERQLRGLSAVEAPQSNPLSAVKEEHIEDSAKESGHVSTKISCQQQLIPVLRRNRLILFPTILPMRTTLNLPREWNWGFSTAYCCLDDDTLLCCIGYSNEVWEVHIGSSTVEVTSYLQKAREYTGIWKHRDWVYVFGGHDGRGKLRSSEKYQIREKSWITLSSSLKAPKDFCSVCELNDSLYISGLEACKSTIERFHPQAETFTLFRTDTNFYSSILCSDGSALYCIHEGVVERGDVNGAFTVLSTFPQVGDGNYWLPYPFQWSGELTSILWVGNGGTVGLFRFNPAGQFSVVLNFDFLE